MAVDKKASKSDATDLNEKQTRKRQNKAKEGAIAMRQMLWPEVSG